MIKFWNEAPCSGLSETQENIRRRKRIFQWNSTKCYNICDYTLNTQNTISKDHIQSTKFFQSSTCHQPYGICWHLKNITWFLAIKTYDYKASTQNPITTKVQIQHTGSFKIEKKLQYATYQIQRHLTLEWTMN